MSKQQKSTKQAKPKAPKGALTPATVVRLFQGNTVARSLLVAEKNELSLIATELTLDKKDRNVTVTTTRRAEVRDGRIFILDKPVQIGQTNMLMDEALTAAEAAQRASKWLKRAKALDALARQGDPDAGEKAKKLRANAHTLCRAYNLKVEKDGTVTVKSKTANAETNEPAK